MKTKASLKVLKGKVLSVVNKNTAVVEHTRFVEHPIYKKRIKRIKKYQVHDEIGVSVGDLVAFIPSRPYSKTKKWKIVPNKVK